MSPAALTEETQRALDQVSQTLRSPSAARLEGALAVLRNVRAQWQSVAEASDTPPSVAIKLRRRLSDCQVLAQQAGALYLGFAAVVLSASGTYTAAGEAVLPSGCRQFSVEG